LDATSYCGDLAVLYWEHVSSGEGSQLVTAGYGRDGEAWELSNTPLDCQPLSGGLAALGSELLVAHQMMPDCVRSASSSELVLRAQRVSLRGATREVGMQIGPAGPAVTAIRDRVLFASTTTCAFSWMDADGFVGRPIGRPGPCIPPARDGSAFLAGNRPAWVADESATLLVPKEGDVSVLEVGFEEVTETRVPFRPAGAWIREIRGVGAARDRIAVAWSEVTPDPERLTDQFSRGFVMTDERLSPLATPVIEEVAEELRPMDAIFCGERFVFIFSGVDSRGLSIVTLDRDGALLEEVSLGPDVGSWAQLACNGDSIAVLALTSTHLLSCQAP
jgi:hypothetical protein